MTKLADDYIVKDLIRNFIVGGLVISSVSYLATFMGPLIGAIWWSFPLSLLPSIYFMHRLGKDNDYIAEFALSTTYALVLLAATTYALAKFIKEDKEGGVWWPIFKSAGVWVVLSAIFYFVIQTFGLKKYFM